MSVTDIVVLIGWALAVARVSRISAADRITEDIRIALVHRFGVTSMASYLINCIWCTSIWVAAASMPVAVYMAHSTWSQAVVFALAASQVAGMATFFDRDDLEIEVKD